MSFATAQAAREAVEPLLRSESDQAEKHADDCWGRLWSLVMAISNIRFAAKPASPLDPVEDMRTAVGRGYLLFAVRRWDYRHDRLGEGVGAEQKRTPVNPSLRITSISTISP